MWGLLLPRQTFYLMFKWPKSAALKIVPNVDLLSISAIVLDDIELILYSSTYTHTRAIFYFLFILPHLPLTQLFRLNHVTSMNVRNTLHTYTTEGNELLEKERLFPHNSFTVNFLVFRLCNWFCKEKRLKVSCLPSHLTRQILYSNIFHHINAAYTQICCTTHN